MQFEWDPEKAASNSTKHGVTFEFAQRIFEDPHMLEDYQFEGGEERWKALGRVDQKILVVVYTERDAALRIISAREAEKNEQKFYLDNILQR